MGHLEDCVGLLSSTDDDLRCKAARDVKNSAIGNRPTKHRLLQLGALPLLVALVRLDERADIVVNAVAAIGSFACRDEEGAEVVLGHGALWPLLNVLKHHDEKVVRAAVQAMKIVFQAACAPRDALVQSGTVPRLIALMRSAHDDVAAAAAGVLARCCATLEQQTQLASYDVVEVLQGLLMSPTPRNSEAALDVLAALSFHNSSLAKQIASCVDVLPRMMTLVQAKRVRSQLLAVECLTNLYREGAPVTKDDVMTHVFPAIVKLLEETGEIQENVPLVLARLVAGDEDLQKAACDVNCIAKLSTFLIAPQGVAPKLKENVLLCLAALASRREEGRMKIVEGKVLGEISEALGDTSPGVRAAACLVARSLSRSVKTIRTSLVDSGFAPGLMGLLRDKDIQVREEACATLCNIVLDFCPLKEALVECGIVRELVSLVHAVEDPLRLHSIWALKNLLYQSTLLVRDRVMSELTWSDLLCLLEDVNTDVREQALAVVRNLAVGKFTDIERVLRGGGDHLFRVLEGMFQHGTPDRCMIQALYVVCNIATGSELQKRRIIGSDLLPCVLKATAHHNPAIRVAAVWCVINLAWERDVGATERVERMRAMGFENALVNMRGDPDLDVRDRVRTALELFSKFV